MFMELWDIYLVGINKMFCQRVTELLWTWIAQNLDRNANTNADTDTFTDTDTVHGRSWNFKLLKIKQIERWFGVQINESLYVFMTLSVFSLYKRECECILRLKSEINLMSLTPSTPL